MSKEILGYVNKILSKPWEKPFTVSIILTEENDEEITVQCSFFCPLDEDDILHGFINLLDERNKLYEFSEPPFVQVPVSEDSIKLCFIRALKGSGFGAVASDKLYLKLQDSCKASGYSFEENSSEEKTRLKDINKKDILKVVHPDKNHFLNINGNEKSYFNNLSLEIIEEFSSIKKVLKSIKTEVRDEIFVKICDKLNINNPFVEKNDYINSKTVIKYLTDLSVKYEKNDAILNELIAGTDLKPVQAKSLLVWWNKKRSVRRLHLFGLNNTEIKKCSRTLDEIYNICVKNPFILPSIPLDKAQNIYKMMQKDYSSIDLTCGKIVRFINEKLEINSWTCTPYWIILKSFPSFHSLKDILEKEYELFFDINFCYLKYPYQVEKYVTEYIDKLIKLSVKDMNKKMKKLIVQDSPNLESRFYVCKTLTEEQKIAIQGCLENRISIINSGAGCGKTLCIREMVHNLELREIPYHVASFTGKACSRANQILGKSGIAATMDRSIMIASKIPKFKYLILDEASMITTELFYRFIKAFPFPFRIIIIGDINQLATISWGAFMNALLISKRIPIYKLTINHRIINNSDLALINANKLIEPERLLEIKESIHTDPIQFETGKGFYFEDQNIHYINTIINALKENEIKIKDIAILSPFNANLLELNKIVQNIYLEKNLKKKDKVIKDKYGKIWCVGDRVMMLSNNYEIMVMNGDEGYVKSIIFPNEKYTDGGINVRFNCHDENVAFSLTVPIDKLQKTKMGDALNPENFEDVQELNINSLMHSFAVTVDKYQGSEIEYCIIFIPNRGTTYISNFINVNRLYTAITRCKRCCWLIGDLTTINNATCKVQSIKYDLLGYRLKDLKNEENEKCLENLVGIEEEKKEEEENIDYDYDYDNNDFCPEDYDF